MDKLKKNLDSHFETVQAPAGMAARLENLIEALPEQSCRECRENRESLRPSETRRRLYRAFALSVGAVAVALALAVFFPARPSSPLDTCATPEEAYIQAYQAVGQLATAMGKSSRFSTSSMLEAKTILSNSIITIKNE